MQKATPITKYAISSSATIEEALKAITLNKRGAVIVVGPKNKVVGVASDGDIRRALVRGSNVMAPIARAMNPNIVFARKGSDEDKDPDAFFRTHRNITLLPVVTSDFVLSHLYKLPD
jgi:CBS domain-containing protein